MKLSEGEKLIAVMLADIKEKLGAGGEIDADFVKSAISERHEWAFDWEYSYLCNEGNRNPPEVDEVTDILDTWRFLRNGYAALSQEDKKYVATSTSIKGEEIVFPGFDGNNESEYFSIARFLIEKLGRYTEINPLALNSHGTSLPRYRRMNKVFAPIRATLGTSRSELTRDEIITILKA